MPDAYGNPTREEEKYAARVAVGECVCPPVEPDWIPIDPDCEQHGHLLQRPVLDGEQ
jgi:hypothetical protein